jgi:excisionase family DNA binding protein
MQMQLNKDQKTGKTPKARESARPSKLPGQAYFGKVLTLSETAEFLRVHNSTVYRMLSTGQLRAFKVGRVWRFNVEDIDQWRLSKSGGSDDT